MLAGITKPAMRQGRRIASKRFVGLFYLECTMAYKHLFIGSDAASQPLADATGVIRDPNSHPRHIVVPTSMSDREQPAIRLAADLTLACQGRMTVLYVYKTTASETSLHWLDGIERLHRTLHTSGAQIQEAENSEQLKLRLKRFIERLLPARQLSQITVGLACIADTEPQAIAKYANEAAADTIVILGSNSRPLWPIIPGSIRKLLRNSRQQILVAYPRTDCNSSMS